MKNTKKALLLTTFIFSEGTIFSHYSEKNDFFAIMHQSLGKKFFHYCFGKNPQNLDVYNTSLRSNTYIGALPNQECLAPKNIEFNKYLVSNDKNIIKQYHEQIKQQCVQYNFWALNISSMLLMQSIDPMGVFFKKKKAFALGALGVALTFTTKDHKNSLALPYLQYCGLSYVIAQKLLFATCNEKFLNDYYHTTFLYTHALKKLRKTPTQLSIKYLISPFVSNDHDNKIQGNIEKINAQYTKKLNKDPHYIKNVYKSIFCIDTTTPEKYNFSDSEQTAINVVEALYKEKLIEKGETFFFTRYLPNIHNKKIRNNIIKNLNAYYDQLNPQCLNMFYSNETLLNNKQNGLNYIIGIFF